jgi:hypothetical protein
LLALTENLPLLIAPAREGGRVWHRLPRHFKTAVREIDEPVLLDASSSIEGPLPISVIGQRGLRYFDYKDSTRGTAALVRRVSRATRAIFGSGSQVRAGRAKGIWARR